MGNFPPEDWSEEALRREALAKQARLDEVWDKRSRANVKSLVMMGVAGAIILAILACVPPGAPWWALVAAPWGAISTVLVTRFRLNHLYACILVAVPCWLFIGNPFGWLLAGGWGMFAAIYARGGKV
jgi:hypothetical protein